MRKNAWVGFLFVFFVSSLLVVSSAFGQDLLRPDDRYQGYPKSLIQWPTKPPDMTACRNSEYYEPADFHLTKYVSRVKVSSIRIQGLDECSWMLTRNGWRWVLRPRGTKVAQDALGRDLFDFGSPNGQSCTNPRPLSFAIIPVTPVVEKPFSPPAVASPPPLPQPLPMPPQPATPAPAPVPLPTPRAPVELRRYEAPPPTYYPDPEYLEEPENDDNGWGFTSAGLVDKFRSSPVSNVVSRISDRDVCFVDGRAFDVGMAWGKPGSSFWRFTFAGKVMDDGSFTRYYCPDCYTEVKTVALGMKVLGGSIERVQRFGPDEWPVQPMVTVHAGVGRVSGFADRYTSSAHTGMTTVQRVEAKELFNSSLFPIIGAGAGIAGEIGSQWTYGVSVAGVEYPGVYYGRVQLTYWFK